LVGERDLDCEALPTDDRQQRPAVFTARPGTASYERPQLLRVVGLRDPAPGPDGRR
jgi:hypothetical protein